MLEMTALEKTNPSIIPEFKIVQMFKSGAVKSILQGFGNDITGGLPPVLCSESFLKT